MSLLKVENISYSVEVKEEKKKQFDILQNVSFEVEQGEIIGICGESGGGKSTLAKVISGLIKPDSGKIILDSKFEKEKRRGSPIQILFQNHGEVLKLEIWDSYWTKHRETNWELNRPQATILERIGFKGKSVLEVGVGSGTTSRYLAARGASTVGIDISRSAIQLIKGESSVIDLVCGDARALPFSDCSLEVVFHQGVLEHFEEPLPLLLEQRRVLKDGGALLVDVPQRYQPYTLMKRRRMRDGTWPFGWETEYSYFELKRLFEDVGFEIRGHYA